MKLKVNLPLYIFDDPKYCHPRASGMCHFLNLFDEDGFCNLFITDKGWAERLLFDFETKQWEKCEQCKKVYTQTKAEELKL